VIKQLAQWGGAPCASRLLSIESVHRLIPKQRDGSKQIRPTRSRGSNQGTKEGQHQVARDDSEESQQRDEIRSSSKVRYTLAPCTLSHAIHIGNKLTACRQKGCITSLPSEHSLSMKSTSGLTIVGKERVVHAMILVIGEAFEARGGDVLHPTRGGYTINQIFSRYFPHLLGQ
jgi:hypothetical protein